MDSIYQLIYISHTLFPPGTYLPPIESVHTALPKHTALAGSIPLKPSWVLSSVYSLTFTSQNASCSLLTLFLSTLLLCIFFTNLSTWPNYFKVFLIRGLYHLIWPKNQPKWENVVTPYKSFILTLIFPNFIEPNAPLNI